MSENEFRTALHEAGHAVVALAVGRSVYCITIDGDNPHCWFSKQPDLRTHLFILFAGRIAENEGRSYHEAELRKRLAKPVFDETDDIELQAKALYLLAYVATDVERGALWSQYQDEATAIFARAEWRALFRKVAERLVAERTLSGFTLSSIVEASALRAMLEAA